MLTTNAADMDTARVAMLFRNGRSAYVATLAGAAVLVVALWGPLTSGVLAAWFAAVLAVTLARVLVHRAWLAAAGRGEALRWEVRHALGAFAAGALWSVPPAVFLPAVDPLRQMVLLLLVGSLLIGAAGTYAGGRFAFAAFVPLPLAASVLQLLALGGAAHGPLAFAFAVFGALLVLVFRNLDRLVVQTLAARFELEALHARAAGSETRLREAIEAAPPGMAIFDELDRLVACNRAWAARYGGGRDPVSLVGLPYPGFAVLAHAIEGGEAGREAWIEARIGRHREADGVPRLVQDAGGGWHRHAVVRTRRGDRVEVVSDVSDLKHAEAAWRRLLEQEDRVLDALPVGVALVEAGVIRRANRRLEEMLGYGPGELHGLSTRMLYPDERSWRAAGEAIVARMRAGGFDGGEAVLMRRDGSRLQVIVHGRPLDPAAPLAGGFFSLADAGEREAAAEALRRSETRYRDLVETSNDLIWSIDAEGCWSYLNAAGWRRLHGTDPAAFVGRPFDERVVPELRPRDRAVFGRLLAGASMFDFRTRHLHEDGREIDLSFNAVPLRDANGAVIGATGSARDVGTQRRGEAALQGMLERLRLAVAAARLTYWEWDARTGDVIWGRNPLGLADAGPAAGARRLQPLEAIHPGDREIYRTACRRAVETGAPLACEFRVLLRDGGVRHFRAHGTPQRGAGGVIDRIIGISQDVSEERAREETVRHFAYHDALTELPNRRLLEDRLCQAMWLAERRGGRLGLLLVDLDGFKEVNDTAGHAAGDAVLREVARRFGDCVRRSDTLARLGGDEFVVVIPELGADAEAQVVADKLLRSLAAPFEAEGRVFALAASIGIAVYPADAPSGDALLRAADAAMYRAKRESRGGFRFVSA